MIRIRRIAAHNFKQLREVDLHLPPHGRFLIHGKNEAGKSTLFEAVFFGLFGQALVTETSGRSLEDLIAYDVEKARVELWVEAPGRLLKIHRTIVRGKPNVWELWVERPSGVEEVRGNVPVNQRIVDELGFDGEALLNTCFVEQKKLEKLEGMGKAQREGSLMKLLNLEQMTRLEADLKLRAEDRLEVERCRQRAELARVQAELPALEEDFAELETRLRRASLREAALDAREELQAIATVDEQLAALRARREECRQVAEEAEALREAMVALREAMTAVERAQEQQRTIEALKEEQAAARELAEREVPHLEERLRTASSLLSRLRRLETLSGMRERQAGEALDLRRRAERAREAAEAMRRAKAEFKETEGAARAAHRRLQELLEAHQAARETEWLAAWLSAEERASAPARHEAAIEQTRQRMADLSAEFKEAAAAILARLSERDLTGLADAVRVFVQRALQLWGDFSQASQELVRLESEREAQFALAEAGREERSRVEERAGTLGLTVPAAPGEARTRHDTAIQRCNGRSPAELEPDLAAARTEAGNRAGRLDNLQKTVTELEARLVEDPDQLTREAESLTGRVARMGSIVERWMDRTAQTAQALGLAPGLQTCQAAVAELRAQKGALLKELARAASIPVEIERLQAEARRFLGEAEVHHRSAREKVPELAPWEARRAPADIETLGKGLRRRYDELGGRDAQARLQEAVGEVQRREGERQGHVRRLAELAPQLAHELRAIGLPLRLSDPPRVEELDLVLEYVADVAEEDRGALQEERDRLQQRVGYLRQQRVDLETRLGLAGEALDPEACAGELAGLERGHAVRERARRIVETARRRMVEKILPSTMEHMRQLLPTLTMQRYYDAELTDEYRIRVWDERAGDKGGWREKNIFSGGTKDQFSLALRLAFALATLPAERGTAPSFIFLDEPLGSFDDERAQALLHLLTEGEIAHSFDQILLISHVRVNPHLFTYHITLDAGRVVEHDLPSPDQ